MPSPLDRIVDGNTVTRYQGLTRTVQRGFCIGGSLVALGLTGNPTGQSAPAGASSHLGGVHAHSGSVVVQEGPGEEAFRQFCVACHGEGGRGDGPAAAGLKPPPADFTNPEGVSKLSDAEVVAVITEGRAFMPAFGRILKAEVLPDLVAYVRELSRGTRR